MVWGSRETVRPYQFVVKPTWSSHTPLHSNKCGILHNIPYCGIVDKTYHIVGQTKVWVLQIWHCIVCITLTHSAIVAGVASVCALIKG